LIVLDIVEVASPEIKAQWQLHCPTKPQIGDHQVTVANSPPKRTWANPTLLPASEGAKLFCQTLAPRDYTLLLHADGKAQAFGTNGRSRGICEANPFHREFGGNVVQIEATDKALTMVFLHVLTAAEESQTDPPEIAIQLIDPGEVELKVDGRKTILTVPKGFRQP
jgi:hypothetical protein